MSTIRVPSRVSDPPACIDCRHFIVTGLARTQCVRPQCSQFDLIVGRQSVTPEDARKGQCTAEARFFEPRPPLSWLDRNFSRVLMGVLLVAVAAFVFKPWIVG